MLIGKSAGKIKEFFVFHKRCWLGHWREYWEMEGKGRRNHLVFPKSL